MLLSHTVSVEVHFLNPKWVWFLIDDLFSNFILICKLLEIIKI